MAEENNRAKGGKMKILVLRFSSIGDIVLTSPVVRCIKTQMPGVQLHFLTKKSFGFLLESSPYIDHLHTFEKDIDEVVEEIKSQNFDLIIDLHNNLRSKRLLNALGVDYHAFPKLNIQKALATTFKIKGFLPKLHIVDRYFETIKSLPVKNDHLGLDYFLPTQDQINIAKTFPELGNSPFIALVAGGSYFTKQIPNVVIERFVVESTLPVILLGDTKDGIRTKIISDNHPHVINACGRLNFHQSASMIKQAEFVVSSDTGLMHVAAAFKKKVISVWGNTIPEFGMGPYLPDERSKIIEVEHLKCRPCSKLGYNECPAGHFNCMLMIDVKQMF